MPAEMKVFLNHVYELEKGVRRMALYTADRKFEPMVVERLQRHKIAYLIQPVDEKKMNLFFGHASCIDAVKKIATRPLYQLTPEEDFILGALLGYDIAAQCDRYCQRKSRTSA